MQKPQKQEMLLQLSISPEDPSSDRLCILNWNKMAPEYTTWDRSIPHLTPLHPLPCFILKPSQFTSQIVLTSVRDSCATENLSMQ